jgi:hypothetical protein
MTDRERDAPRRNPDEDTDQYPTPPVAPEDVEAAEEEFLAEEDESAADAASVDDDYEDGEEEPTEADIGAEADDEMGEPTVATAGGAGAAARLRLGQRLGRGGSSVATAPLVTPSERAVRIDDRASQVYVIGVVATFLGIILFAMLWGAGGFFTTPPASPSPSPSPSASASAGPSASLSISLQPSAASPSGAGTSSAPATLVAPSPAGS